IAVGEIPLRPGATPLISGSGLFLLVGGLGILVLAVARALLELVLRLAQAPSQLRQLRPTEDQQDDQQDDDQFGRSKVHGRSFPRSCTAYVANTLRGSSSTAVVTRGRGDLPSRTGTGCGDRRSARCRRRCRRGRGGTCAAPRGRRNARRCTEHPRP